MRKYETLLLLSPELNEEERKQIQATLLGVVERENGQVVTVDDWGMRELAFPVRKQMRGYYLRLEYSVSGAVVKELERIIRITDGVYKFVTVKLADAPEAEEAA